MPLLSAPDTRAVLKGRGGELRNANRNERSRGRSLLHGHGTFSTSKVGGWRLTAVGGGWRLAVGDGWRLAAVGAGRLVVPGGCSEGLSLTKKKIWLLKESPAADGQKAVEDEPWTPSQTRGSGGSLCHGGSWCPHRFRALTFSDRSNAPNPFPAATNENALSPLCHEAKACLSPHRSPASRTRLTGPDNGARGCPGRSKTTTKPLQSAGTPGRDIGRLDEQKDVHGCAHALHRGVYVGEGPAMAQIYTPQLSLPDATYSSRSPMNEAVFCVTVHRNGRMGQPLPSVSAPSSQCHRGPLPHRTGPRDTHTRTHTPGATKSIYPLPRALNVTKSVPECHIGGRHVLTRNGHILGYMWDAKTSAFSPFGARDGPFWPSKNPKMP